jgi:hypothetical protein
MPTTHHAEHGCGQSRLYKAAAHLEYNRLGRRRWTHPPVDAGPKPDRGPLFARCVETVEDVTCRNCLSKLARLGLVPRHD